MLSNALLILASLAAPALAAPTARQNGIQVVNSCYNNGQVALTYDDGPFAYEYGIADALNSVGGKGTFFLNGNNYGCIYDNAQVLRDLHAQQHTLGSHTWSHKDLTSLSYDQIHDELWRVEEAMIKILGVKPKWLRPPYGNYNDLVLRVMSERGYTHLALWTDDTGDSLGEDGNHQKGVMAGVANSYPQAKMVLQHSTIQSAVDTTWYGVNELRNKGYQLVATDVCTNSDWPYTWVGEPQQPDGSWHC